MTQLARKLLPLLMRGDLIAFPVALCLWLGQTITAAQAATSLHPTSSMPPYRDDRILIQPKPEVSATTLAQYHSVQKVEVLHTFAGIGRMQVVRVPAGDTVPDLITKYEQSGLVEFAEPDFLVYAALTPNDPKFVDGTLWGLENTGQSGGGVDADIDAPEAWAVLTSAGNIVVAVLDSGVRSTHEDLASNMWINPLDGGHGFNAFTGTNDPSDDGGHGTLVAGVLGAVGNNGKGVAGVAWQVRIMALKSLDSTGTGSDSTLIVCIDYARTNGARIINASLDSPAYSAALSNAIFSARQAGIIFVASAGNNRVNIDTAPRYPSCYHIDNVVSVAYSTRTDELGVLSNFGATNVDLVAPGEQMYSTYFTADDSYFGGGFLSGSSLAAPYVTGALALMLTKFPTETHQQIIHRVLNATDSLPALAGKCVTGGRLNLSKALSPPISLGLLQAGENSPVQLRVSGGPHRSCVIEITTNLTSWSPVFTNITSASGTFDFTDNQSTNIGRRFYRVTSTP